ncbi:hypothetical protein BYT27DRAFT_7187126 [Phlegmacium glaucopus]|nr:hypothetical protein BYT27DRAFT_7187126 [Phlegmacium glaucopus]
MAPSMLSIVVCLPSLCGRERSSALWQGYIRKEVMTKGANERGLEIRKEGSKPAQVFICANIVMVKIMMAPVHVTMPYAT